MLDERFLNVRQILIYQAGYFGMRKREAARRADALLAEFGLDARRNASVQELSGGMKRRLVLCKALMHDPPTLILDEPTAGADVPLRRQLWDKVQRLNRAGKTVLLTTHYLEEAERLCQRVAILHRGRIVRLGPPEDLVRESVPTWVAIQTDPPLTQVPAEVPATLSPRLDAGDLYLRGTLHDPQVIRALTALARQGAGVRSLEQQTARLEDAFVELTKESM